MLTYAAMALYLGTSGFAYKEWKGVFYPEGTRDADMLRFYATRFPAVEINYTFRRQPAPTTLANWVERTPPAFRFAAKAHQRITHTLRLRDADEAVSRFLESVRPLGERLGPVLFQCPPFLKYDRGLIESFLVYLPPTVRAAFEFRHPSWAEAKELLAEQGAAWCVAETEEQEAGVMSWEPFGYLRLRKQDYTEEEIAAWATRIRGALNEGRDVYCFFKHEEHGAAFRYADRLRELVG